MPLSWNEIKVRASYFSNEWRDTAREEADAKPFLIEFLNIFGISQKRVATFEHRVKKIDAAAGYIDLLWPGTLLVEMKSRGQDLEKAYKQAKDYCHGLKEYELPKLILISDFHHFHVYRDDGLVVKFILSELVESLQIFEELAGYQKRTYHEEDPVNIAAAELMGKLHDQLKDIGYTGEILEVYLVRLVFILFADDSTIFQKGIFLDYLEQRTREDGSDLGMHLDQLFQILDTPEDKRLKTLDEQLNIFPYVNGRLFERRLPTASFNSAMRRILLDCCKLDWGKISPAIFGSLFQSVMDATARRNLGAHYTSEKNIMKLIKPLFVDALWEEFHAAGSNHTKLKQLHAKISKLRFLDPACGCGNFLITSYKELRLLELAIVEILLKGQMVTNINQYFLVDLRQFYGIEIGEFPSQIAQVAMWLIDHQMNMMVSDRFGEYIPLIPLRKSAYIVNTNSLEIDWQSIVRPLAAETEDQHFQFILGNPPFLGKHLQSSIQKQEVERLFSGENSSGILDYVAAWYIKAAQYMRQFNSNKSEYCTKAAFVSTNSVCQGEQVGVLWKALILNYHIKIHFAHQTFKWNNEARGNAAVHVVIIGFANFDSSERYIYEYDDPKGEPREHKVKNISPYLVEGNDSFVSTRKKPICAVPEMVMGSKPTDDGYLLMTDEEKIKYLSLEPHGEVFVRPMLSAREYLYNEKRWCFWLVDADPIKLKGCPLLLKRIAGVKDFRQKSKKVPTQKLADRPGLFGEIRQPKSDFILIPLHTSESRTYIPFGFFDSTYIVSNSCSAIPNATAYHFGVLSSRMHMIWVKYVCGRLESRFRYSNDLVYNNFPWPESLSAKQVMTVEEAARNVLKVRTCFPDSSLADLYDPNTMQLNLIKAHQQLDKAVDLCYRSQPFLSEAKRLEYLFELYDRYTAGIFQPVKKQKAKV